MRVMNHNWLATKQRLHLQSVAEMSRHSVLSVAISFCRHRSVPVPCENGSAETTVAEGGQNLVARLWGHTLGEN